MAPTIPSTTPSKRGPGRPKGSKNTRHDLPDGEPPTPKTALSGQFHQGNQSLSMASTAPPTVPLKRKLGRPKGSKNKNNVSSDGGPLAKRARIQNGNALPIHSVHGASMLAPEGFGPLPLASAVDRCAQVANLIGSSLSAPKALSTGTAALAASALAAIPQTPKKKRKSTSEDSPHVEDGTQLTAPKTPRTSTSAKSEHFSPKKRAGASVIRFPPLKSPTFGLIQEELRSNPFHVLLATMLLAKTTGKAAIPVIRVLTERYPTPESMAAAIPEDIFPDIQHLGLGSRRAQAMIELATAWCTDRPEIGKRYKRKDYPNKGSGKDIEPRDEPLSDEDPRDAYEVAHLPHIGPYGIDSWRIFCRDDLRGKPSRLRKGTLKGEEDAHEFELAQEWTGMQPADKELRAYLKWRWLRLGVDWDPASNKQRDVEMSVLKKMQKGKILEHEGFSSPWKGA